MEDDVLSQCDPRAGRTGLPAWSYTNPELLEEEKDLLFRRHWQVVCHVNDIQNPGDFMAMDFTGERALVIRGSDGEVRAFHNLCRHRGSRVVAEEKGRCKSAIICPFHGWAFNLDGTLRGAARPETLPDLDPQEWGLKPIEMDIWQGFVFVRFKPGPQPSVSDVMAQFQEELAPYDLASLLPDGNGISSTEIAANWKCVRDVDNEGYHVPLAHPSLQELYGRDYRDLFLKGGLSASFGYFGDKPGRRWSVRHYTALSTDRPELPDHLRRAWSYYGLFPNQVFAFTPEGAQFYHDLPISPRKTRLTGRLYRRAVEPRQQRLARYLAQRIDRDTSAEDQQLTIWSNEAMLSQAFEGFHLSDLEYGVRRHHDRLRRFLPVMRQEDAPADADLAELNAELLGKAVSAAP